MLANKGRGIGGGLSCHDEDYGGKDRKLKIYCWDKLNENQVKGKIWGWGGMALSDKNFSIVDD